MLSAHQVSDVPDRDPAPNDPLSPYDPSNVPDLPGNGRTWFAIVMVLMLLLGGVYSILSLLFSL
jgi:hypothetical protein